MKKVIFKIRESKKSINEIDPVGDLWQVHAILMTKIPASREDATLEDFKNAIRIKCGVTIVESDGPSEERSGMLFTKVRMRFVPNMDPKTVLKQYTKIISQIEGIKKVTFLDGSLMKAFSKKNKQIG